MTKKIFLAMAFVASVLVSCTDDYKDWADPQVVDQPETVSFGDGSVSAVDVIRFADISAETTDIKVCNLNAPTSTGADYTPFYTITLGEQTFPLNTDGTMTWADLKSYVVSVYGKAPVQRDIEATVSMWLTNGTTTVKTATSSPFLVKALPDAPFIDSGYWLVGDMLAWNKEGAKAFNHLGDGDVYDNPEFQIVFTTTTDNQYWKIIPQGNYDGDFWAGGNTGVVGTAIDGDTSMEGNLVTDNPQAGKIEQAGIYRMTINMMEYTYKIEKLNFAEFIYERGVNTSWGDNPARPLWGGNFDGKYEGYMWLNGEFKFMPNSNNWDGDWESAGDNKIADNGGSNCPAPETGFYVVNVDLGEMTYKLTKIDFIDIVGGVEGGASDWSSGPHMTYTEGEGCWEADVTFTGQFKFRGNGNWGNEDGNFGGSLDNIINGSNDNLFPSITGQPVHVKLFLFCNTKSYVEITAN